MANPNRFVTLTIRQRWLDAIMSGEKREEYRDIKPYYDRIFARRLGMPMTVRFRAGYRPDSPIIETVVRPRIGGGRQDREGPQPRLAGAIPKDLPGVPATRSGAGGKSWGAQEERQYYVLEIIAKRWVRRGKVE